MSHVAGLLLAILLLAPGIAQALPRVLVCCDSLTELPSYVSYLPPVYTLQNIAVSGTPSDVALPWLQTAVTTPPAEDAVVILSGTPDVFASPGGFLGRAYDQAQTLANITAMVDAALLSGAEPVLVAPPPILPGCSFPSPPSCTTANSRVAALAPLLESAAAAREIQFVNLYALISALPDPTPLYDDGIHFLSPGWQYLAQQIDPAIQAALTPVCGNGRVTGAEQCDDNNLFDGDGCSSSCAIEYCANGLDDDGDGLADYPADPGCLSATDPSEKEPTLACDDSSDNDADTLIDLADGGCWGAADKSETPDCSDGLDNDGDGYFDLSDTGCFGFGGNLREDPPPTCGLLGLEGLVVLPLLAAVRRRRAARA